MNDISVKAASQEIVLDEVFPHAPETIWRALTTGKLIARWMMEPQGFEPVPGNRFTFKTTPAGEWDGTIHCEVLEVRPNERFVYSWKGGHDGNVGYGARLETIVTFTLTGVPEGTRLRMVHSGFVLPKNEFAYRNMSEGWRKCVGGIEAIASEGETE